MLLKKQIKNLSKSELNEYKRLKSKEYRKTDAYKKYYEEYVNRPEVKKRIKEYNQRPDVKAKARARARKLYHNNPISRQKTKERIERYRKTKKYENWKNQKATLKKLGRPDEIIKICKDHGFSTEVSIAIAVDGVYLDGMMKEKGIIK